MARSSNRGSSSCSAAEKEPSTWACTVSGWAGRPMPIRSLGIACGGARGGPREFRCPVREAPMLAHHTQGRAKGQTHMGIETANAGTDSVVAPSRDMGGTISASLGQHPSPLPAQAGVRAPLFPAETGIGTPTPTPTGRLSSLAHLDLLRASPGASPQLQSHFPQGLVQLIMHQVDLLSSQPKQLRLAQGNGGPGYCSSAQRALSRLAALVRRGRN